MFVGFVLEKSVNNKAITSENNIFKFYIKC